ncbi:MAG TPA: NAD(P)H-nitrite reductase, partial [Microscillaceae bacterium]|nr:NAD(P)H-nitrite reductase [Microscillaceae bacterium]
RVQITQKIKKGVVFLPMHWGKTLKSDFRRANNLTNEKYDPISKEPGYKFSAVQVARYKKAKQKLILVGAGAAAYRFINTYRELNEVDEIHVFSKEEHPFYNRVLLPEYVNEQLDWSALLKFKNDEFEQLNVYLHQATSIEKIDRVAKTVVDSKGNTHTYDKLILATGSRAFLPPGVPVHLPGIFTLRSRKNADELKRYLQGKKQVVIVGGGLLGLELAGALRETNLEVTIVQLASRLMQRQLDPLASKLLLEIIEDMGVQVFLNDEVKDITTTNNANQLVAHLKSGKPIHCEALVYAIGTRPNVELAKAVDVQCGKGVLVNDYLQTNDPDIFAIGEIAEHRQKLSGITAAAEAQANVLANYLSGDLGSSYQGTILMNILKLAQIDLCTLGISEVPNGAKGYEEIILLDQSKYYYKKCIVYQDKLVGAILMGDKAEFAEFKSLIEEGTELSEKRMELLRSGVNLTPVIGELLCACSNVGVGNIQQAIENNGPDFQAICQQTGAGQGCGTCKSEVKNLVESYKIELLKKG